MTLLAGEGKGRSYALDPAVRFLKVLGNETDPNGLLHKVKTVAQLKEMGAEPVDDSCILGDLAYEVEPGFLAEASALQAAATARPVRPPAAQPAPPAAAAQAAAGRAAAQAPARPAAIPAQPAASGAAPARPFGGGPLPKDLEEKRKEAEALARFLLENLS